ncbi:MAG: PAS domain-containing protein, partial [Blastocatellia bacterium]
MTAKRPLILIVDDAPEDIAIYKRYLTRGRNRPYKIREASTGAKALAICRRRRPDCVLLDFRLPDLNGFEVLQALADKSGMLPFAVVMLAEIDDAQIVVDVMKCGAHDFLAKSWITPEILERAIANAIEKSASQREVEEQRRELVIKNLMLEQRLADLQREPRERRGVDLHIPSLDDGANRRRAEEALKLAGESRLKLAIAAMNGGAWEWDLITNEVRWSDEMYELFDCRPSEFTPSVEGWLTTLSAEDRASAAIAIEAVRRGEDAQMIYRATGPDGGARWLELRGITLHDEQRRPVLLVGITIDITERKLAEDALRESEARVHTLAANLSDGLIYQMRRDPDGSRRFLYISENAERLRGVTAEEAMSNVGALYNLIPEDYRARLIEAEDAALRDFTEFRFETPFLTPDGELRWSQQSSAPRRLADGSVIWDGVEIDITERKRAEETLRESEEKFSKVFKASPSRIAIVTLDEGCYIDVNDAVLRTTGYERSEMIGRRVDELRVLVWPGGQDRLIQELQNGPVRDLEVGLRSKSGEVRTVLMSAEVITLNGRQCVVTLSNDITERKRTEEDLREKEKFIQNLIDAVPAGIYIYNMKERRNLFTNPRMASLLGYTSDELTAMGSDFLALLLHPDDWRRAQAHFERLREAPDGSVSELEYRMKHRDGQWRWFFSRELVFMRDANGRPLQILGVAQEITERKRVEEALRENEERLRLAIEAANAGSFDWDIASGVIVWTPGGSSQPRVIEQDYQSWRATVHPQDIDWVEADVAKSLAERRDLYIEYRVLRPDSSVRWVSNIGHTFYNEAGQPARMNGLRIDLTERKRAEEALRESEERLRLALEGAKAGVWEVKFDPYRAYWSREYRDLFGFSETDEATNELWATRVHRDDLQRVVDGNNALLSSDHNEMRQEFRIMHPAHGERWILDFVRVRRDRAGRPISFGGINFDVTGRKRAEEAMRESEERFRELVETISDVFWIMHPESQVPVYLSPACERLWGRPATELNGNLDKWFDAIHPEDRERVRKKYLAKAGEGGYNEIYRVVRPDGSTVWVHDRGFPVCDETGAIRHIVGVAEDITDRKRVEDELRESQRRYEALAEAVPQLVWTAAADGGVDYFNQRWYTYTGMTPDDSLNQAWRSLIHPDDRERVEKLWKRGVRAGEHLHFEFRLRGADGGYHWFIGRGVPYRDERRDATPRKRDGENGAVGARNGATLDSGKGRILKWFGTFTDIHDLKITEDALRLSEEHARQQNAELETIYQATPVGLSLLDRDFRIMRINETLAEIDGVTVDQALGRTTRELTPGVADRLEPIFKRVIKTGRPIMNIEIHGETPREPGVERDWLASYYPVKAADGSVQGVGCVVLEITERKRAEGALRESEERLRQAAQAAGFGLYSVDLQTGENYWSPELRRIFGLSDDDAVVLDKSLELIHPNDREETTLVAEAALDPRGDGEFEHEFRALLPDGNTRWALAKGKTLFVGNGRRRKASRIIGVAFDITERKEDEDRLQASERRLKLSLAAGHAGTWEWRIKEDKLIWSDEYY